MLQDYLDVFKKRSRSQFFRGRFEDINGLPCEMHNALEDESKTFPSGIPKSYMREHKCPDHATPHESGFSKRD